MEKVKIGIGAQWRNFWKNVKADWEMSVLVAFGTVLLIIGAVTLERPFITFGASILIGKAACHI